MVARDHLEAESTSREPDYPGALLFLIRATAFATYLQRPIVVVLWPSQSCNLAQRRLASATVEAVAAEMSHAFRFAT